ncbi:MAG: hypothetical protein IKB19_05035 [Rikenellaceae bacterium]|nr:hypothetical protein [Rikenellaceae bacterium]
MTLLCGVLLGGCAVKEWSEERVLRKAEIWLDYTALTSDVRLLLFDSKGLYRDSLMCGVGGEGVEPSRVTYLYNGVYKAVSVSQPLECELCVADEYGQTTFKALEENGYYTPVGDVRTDIFDFSIVKGDSKSFAPTATGITSSMTLRVEGLQWIDNPEGLHFEYDYATAAQLDGTPSAERGTYRPQTTISGDLMTGEWRTFYGEANPDFVIRLVSADGEVLYQKNIREQMTDSVDIDILIEFSKTQIQCTVADWTETVERIIVDIE